MEQKPNVAKPPPVKTNPQQSNSDDNSRKRKFDAIQLLSGKTWSITSKVNGCNIQAIIDSGATLSAVSKNCVPEKALKRSSAIPIKVGSSDTIYSLGDTILHLTFGEKIITQKAVVIDTNAFQAVLGTDF